MAVYKKLTQNKAGAGPVCDFKLDQLHTLCMDSPWWERRQETPRRQGPTEPRPKGSGLFCPKSMLRVMYVRSYPRKLGPAQMLTSHQSPALHAPPGT